jgi:hypothetical protein
MESKKLKKLQDCQRVRAVAMHCRSLSVTLGPQITDEILPMLVADPNNLQNLPEIVMKLKQSMLGPYSRSGLARVRHLEPPQPRMGFHLIYRHRWCTRERVGRECQAGSIPEPHTCCEQSAPSCGELWVWCHTCCDTYRARCGRKGRYAAAHGVVFGA